MSIHPDPGRHLTRAEVQMQRASVRTIRSFLQSARRGLLEGSGAIAAAGEVPDSARMLAWWGDAVDQHLAESIRTAWMTGYRATTSLDVVRRSLDAVGEYVVAATDRLSRTATPLIPEQAWQRLQVALSEEIAVGSSSQAISRRIAAELRWDTDTVFWEQRKAAVATQLDEILDPLGPPGSAAREAARANDPRVRALQVQNATATRRLDAEKSFWQTRADRIARTETTGAYNGGSFDAALRTGASVKRWVAAGDRRVRSSHTRAEGQTVRFQDPFSVGGARLQYPGEVGGPAEETVNCRCTMTFPEDVSPLDVG